jgi:hypothetical protein
MVTSIRRLLVHVNGISRVSLIIKTHFAITVHQQSRGCEVDQDASGASGWHILYEFDHSDMFCYHGGSALMHFHSIEVLTPLGKSLKRLPGTKQFIDLLSVWGEIEK